jgi:RimJ/RimL family protein N-acetyltransferase
MEITFERITTKNDLEVLKFWLEDEELLKRARMRDIPLDEKDYEEYLKTLSYFIVVDNLAIGYARIYRYPNPKEGEIGIVIALPEYRKLGIGTIVGKRLIPVCLAMGMNAIRWATAADNLPSIGLAEKLGFKFEQYLPDVIQLKDGKYNALVFKLEVNS